MTQTRIPICDIAALRNGTARQQARIVLDIGAAAREVGFFAIVNHGVPDSLMHGAFAAAGNFFALPAADKDRLSMDRTSHNRGYAQAGAERFESGWPAGGKESFSIGPDLVAATSGTLHASYAGPNGWPPLPGFRDTAMSCFRAMHALAALIQRAFALDLSMPPDFFVPHSDRPLTTLRFLRYPAAPSGLQAAAHGAGAQIDGGIFTVFAHDEFGGLEIAGRDGSWASVEPVPDAFVCTVGDCLTRWSNDRYVSRPHRVLNRADRDRLSIAFLADPSPDTLIACLPTCHDEDHPPKYPPISYAAYRQERSATAVTATA